MIHYGKPFLEANGAIVAGIALGSLSMKTKSIYQGFLVHITVAALMDWLALCGTGTRCRRCSGRRAETASSPDAWASGAAPVRRSSAGPRRGRASASSAATAVALDGPSTAGPEVPPEDRLERPGPSPEAVTAGRRPRPRPVRPQGPHVQPLRPQAPPRGCADDQVGRVAQGPGAGLLVGCGLDTGLRPAQGRAAGPPLAAEGGADPPEEHEDEGARRDDERDGPSLHGEDVFSVGSRVGIESVTCSMSPTLAPFDA